MICIIASDKRKAQMWASTNFLDDNEWFYPYEPNELLSRSNFHVIVVPDGLETLPSSWFNKVYNLAKQRGRMGR